MSDLLPPLPSPPPQASRRQEQIKRLAIRIAKLLLVTLIIWFVYRSMRSELEKTTLAELAELRPNWLYVIGAGLCLAGMNSVQMIRYRALLFACGATPTWRQMLAIAWIPPLGKYIPGSVWALMGAIGMLRRFGINAAIAISVVLMVDAFSEIVGLIFSAPLLMRPPVSDKFPFVRWLALPAILIGMIAMAPPVFGRVIQFALRLLKRPPLERLPTWREYVVPVLSAIAQWLFAGGALWMMTRSIADVPISMFPQFTMIASAAMAIGYLVFFTSAGAGPREYIFMTLLPPLLALTTAPAGTATIVTIAMRLMQILVELALAGLGTLMLRKADAARSTTQTTTTLP